MKMNIKGYWSALCKIKWDQHLNRAALLSQVFLLILAGYGYFYTVIPVYQKEIVEEKLAYAEKKLNSVEIKLNSAEINLANLIKKRKKIYAELYFTRISDINFYYAELSKIYVNEIYIDYNLNFICDSLYEQLKKAIGGYRIHVYKNFERNEITVTDYYQEMFDSVEEKGLKNELDQFSLNFINENKKSLIKKECSVEEKNQEKINILNEIKEMKNKGFGENYIKNKINQIIEKRKKIKYTNLLKIIGQISFKYKKTL